MDRKNLAQVAIVLAILFVALLIVSCAQRGAADIDDATAAEMAKTVQGQQK